MSRSESLSESLSGSLSRSLSRSLSSASSEAPKQTRPQPLADDVEQVATGGEVGAPISARLDVGREARKGIPEVVLAEFKSDEQTLAIARALVNRTGRAILSRLRPATMDLLAEAFADSTVDLRRVARAAVITTPGYQRPSTGGAIGVLAAGTSDIPVAEEAGLIASEMGCAVLTAYDVGVAGLHRLFGPLQQLLDSDVAALVVCAGMDGALPSVVAGLAPVPVIGCPVSVGYGVGGKGRAALLSMLQSCAIGLTVVNVDNGIGAGATAALIANRLAAARRVTSETASR